MDDPEHARKRNVQKQLLAILWPCAVLIFIASVEVLLRVKDVELFDAWVKAGGSTFDQYLNMHLFIYLLAILYPLAFALYSLWALPRFGVSKYYRLVWLALGVISLFYKVIGFRTDSVFDYLNVIFYLLLLYRLAVFKLKNPA